jgi:DNA-binding transcriptional LysR family regulator
LSTVPNLDLYNLVIFYIVAREKSLSAAAEKLYLTQPAVTYHIKALEEYTRVKLLEFKKRQVALTPHGEELFKYAEAVYRQMVDADGYIKAARESSLRAGIASVYISTIGPVVKRMFEEDPEVKLTVRSSDAIELVQDVLDSHLDLAVIPSFDYDEGKLSRTVVSEPQRIICFAAYNQAIAKEPLSWRELADYPLISGPESSVIRQIVFEKLRSEGLEPRQLAAEVDSVDWCKALVEDGKGISFTIAGDIDPEIARKRLKIVALEEEISVAAEVVMRADTFLNPNIERFVSLVREAFA